MGSSFFGMNIAQQGLYTAQTNLNITSHNIANAETEGYSRQYAVQSATSPLTNGRRGMIGTGTEITNVLQHRDAYLDDKYRSLSNELGEFEVKDEILSQLELLFSEPSDTGYSTYFNDIFDSMQTLSKDPGNITGRSAFVDSLSSFSTYLNDMGKQLTTLQEDANFGVSMSVDTINYNAQQLATLNNQIGNLELSGSVANDLRDERNRLVDELSKVINIVATETTDINGQDTYRITIDGKTLVNDTNAYFLEVRPREVVSNPEDTVDIYDVYWENGTELQLDDENLAGELRGYIDLRDGNNGENFTGTIQSGQGTSTLVYSSPSRTDLAEAGELYVNGITMIYHSFDYDSVNDEITFQLGAPDLVGGELAAGKDKYGDDFSGVITKLSNEQVMISNDFNQDLEETGTMSLDGTLVTYTGYSKDPGTNVITLDIVAPAGSDGTASYSGDNIAAKGVPYYISQMNEFVRTLAESFNAVNESGNNATGAQLFTFDGDTTGTTLETGESHTYDVLTLNNFSVNQAVVDDVGLIESSRTPGAGESANELILELVDLRHDDDMFAKGEPENFMESVIGELGIDAKRVSSLLSGQEDLVLLVNNQRLSVSGVDTNEETTNLLKYQLAYELSAKIISIMNEIYDVTINSMGM